MDVDDALIAKIFEEMRALREEVGLLRGERQVTAAQRELIHAIARQYGSREFTSREAVNDAGSGGAAAVAMALVECGVGDNARKLGRKLAKLEGLPISGFCLLRLKKDRDGELWRIYEMRV